MLYTPNQIADYFLSLTDTDKGDTISPLKLQKLVYYAQAWHYTIFKKPLFSEKIQAWVNGPVVPSLYKRFASTLKHGAIDLSAQNLLVPKFPEDTLNLLKDVMNIYGEKSGAYLEQLTHRETPWITARGNAKPYEASTNEITLKSMSEYYSQFAKNAEA